MFPDHIREGPPGSVVGLSFTVPVRSQVQVGAKLDGVLRRNTDHVTSIFEYIFVGFNLKVP